MADLSHGAIAIVRHRLYQHRDAARTIAFINNLVVGHAFFRASAAADCPIDRIVGHVAGLGVENGLAQARVRVGITAAGPGGDGNLFDELSEEFAALGVSGALFMLNRMPLRMSGHLSLTILKEISID